MKTLTKRQEEILNFIGHHEWSKGFWPSIREIQEKFGFKSTNAVMGHLRALERKGAIERIAGQARTFRILGREEDEGPGLPEDAVEVVSEVSSEFLGELLGELLGEGFWHGGFPGAWRTPGRARPCARRRNPPNAA